MKIAGINKINLIRYLTMILLVVIAITGATYGLTDTRVLTNEFIGTAGTSPPGGGGGGGDTISIDVSKIWVPAGDHPDSVRVQLYRNGVPYGGSATLDAGNNWRYRWTGLSRYYTWTVDELAVSAGYTRTVSGNATDGYVITNTLRDGSVTPPPPAPPATPPPGAGETPAPPPDHNIPVNNEEPDPEETPTPEITPGPEDNPKPGKPGTPGSGPKTGDDANPGLWLMLLAASVFLLRRVLFFGEKHKPNQN